MIQKRFLTVAIIIVCDLLAGCSKPCVPAETVRIKIQETVYRLPAAFQPTIYVGRKTFPTRDKIRDGRRVQEYCQRPEDPPATADGFSLGQRSLSLIMKRYPEFVRLEGLDIIAVEYAPASHPPAEKATGALVSDGLFRRADHNGTFELFSTGPLLFRNQIAARCGPAPTHEPSTSCGIWGQIKPGTLIRVDLNDPPHPASDWPRTLEEVERLIKSFTNP
ncbi:hypothetical protein [Microvirga sp. TS319]|uniref:hypothetical protein n=1 Tax=Microvirga sp. TS319 TaxID=3241165 RepID=UPI00351A264C